MGMKAFITGVTFCICVLALKMTTDFLIVGGVFCVIGCILVWLDK